MKYILIGSLLGSLITSSHDGEELCKGRKAMLQEKGAVVECYKEPSQNSFICNSLTCGTIQLRQN